MNNKKYYAENKERENERCKKYYAEHKVQLKEKRAIRMLSDEQKAKVRNRSRKYAAEHKQRKAQATKEWFLRNKHLYRVYHHNRRSKERGGHLSSNLIPMLFKLQKGKCACCGRPLGSDYEADHIIPLSIGGENIDNNIQLLRKSCNRIKASSHPIDYMQSKGFLL